LEHDIWRKFGVNAHLLVSGRSADTPTLAAKPRSLQILRGGGSSYQFVAILRPTEPAWR
jgi:hypothetical protein